MKYFTMIFAIAAALLFAGCGGSGGVDEDKPIDEVSAEAAEMTQAELQKVVDQYETALAEQKAEIASLKEEIKSIPLKEMMGDEARTLKEDLSDVMDSVDALTERLNIYAKELAFE